MPTPPRGTIPAPQETNSHWFSFPVGKGDRASLVAQLIKNVRATHQLRSMGKEVPLEKEMTTHFSILAWRILWTEESGGLQSMGSQRVRHD